MPDKQNNNGTSNSNSSGSSIYGVSGENKSFSVLGELGASFSSFIQDRAQQTTYYRDIVEKRYNFANNYLGNDTSSQSEKQSSQSSSSKSRSSAIEEALTNIKTMTSDIEEEIDDTLNSIDDFIKPKKTEKQAQTEMLEQSKQMSTGEAVFALCLQQILDVTKDIAKDVKAGRQASARIYEDNWSKVGASGTISKTEYQFESAAISQKLLSQGLFADLSTSDIYKDVTSLIEKGYSKTDAETLAMSDAITAKIAPYLDTQTASFKSLQNKFGDSFTNQITGMNNYIQEIAGSSKVWESNASTIISQLEPVQLWAEKQEWGEEELAAVEGLVESGMMTESQASQLVSQALKVSTDSYGSVTNGTIGQKAAVATGNTDFSSALTSLIQTATLANNENKTAQGAGLSVLGYSGIFAENADLDTINSTYKSLLSKAKSSETSAEEESSKLVESLKSGYLTTEQEKITNTTQNSGAFFSWFEEQFPIMTNKLDELVTVDTVISITTSLIAANQAKDLVSSILGGGSSSGTSGLLSGAKSLLSSGLTSLKSLGSSLVSKGSGLLTTLKGFGSSFLSKGTSLLSSGLSSLKSLGTSFLSKGSGLFSSVLTSLKSVGSKLISGLSSGLSSALSSMGSLLSKAGSGLSSAVSAGSGALGSLGGALSSAVSVLGPALLVIAGVAAAGTVAMSIATKSHNKKYEGLTVGSVDSYAVGTDYVEKDKLAYIHKGEAVLTATENQNRLATNNESLNSILAVTKQISSSIANVEKSQLLGQVNTQTSNSIVNNITSQISSRKSGSNVDTTADNVKTIATAVQSLVDTKSLNSKKEGEDLIVSTSKSIDYQQSKQNEKTNQQKLIQTQAQVQVEQEEKNDKLIKELKTMNNQLIAAIKTYCYREKGYVYDDDVVQLKCQNET